MENTGIMIKLRSLEIRGALVTPVKPEKAKSKCEGPGGRTKITTILIQLYKYNLTKLAWADD